MTIKYRRIDIIDEIPDPEVIRDQIREHVRRADLLRALLRVAIRRKEAAGRESAGRVEVPCAASGY
jgi:hypothetical protein